MLWKATKSSVEPLLNGLFLNGVKSRSGLTLKQPKFVSCITGGGGSFFQHVLGKAGASSTLLEGIIPYDKQSCLSFLDSASLDSRNIGFCSKEMAARLAVASHRRAIALSPIVSTWPDLYGISATATIVSHYKRRGDYRVHVGTCDSSGKVRTLCFTFQKGYRSRESEDAGIGFLALRALFEAAQKSTGEVLPPEARSPDWIVTEAPPEPVMNEVGEIAQGVEEVPQLMPFNAPNNENTWTCKINDEEIQAPDSLLPADTMIIVPAADMNIGRTFGATISKLGLRRDGPMGKSWTCHQPPTLILDNEFADLTSSSLLSPDDTCGDESGDETIENWGLLCPPSSVNSQSPALSTLSKYMKSGCTFVISIEMLAKFCTNLPLLLEALRAGCSLVVCGCGCGEKEVSLTSVMKNLASSTSKGDFFVVAHSLTLVNSPVMLEQTDYTDSSPSTRDVKSEIRGDSATDGFVKIEWVNGITYSGFIENGLFSGLGSKMYSKGGGYLGQWKENKREGTGVSVYGGKWGYDRWEGGFTDDKPEGTGTMFGVDGDVKLDFRFENGEPV